MSDSIDLLTNGPPAAKTTILLAHGAGAPMDSPFMNFFAEELASRKFRVVRFEFPYMHRRRVEGTKSPPNRGPILEKAWLDVVDSIKAKRLIIGGKSMGGRIASMIADQATVDGLVCLGYPFHPPGKPDRLRTDHLVNLKTPSLICQGERDTFGRRSEVKEYQLSNQIRFHWLADGDHSFKPRKASGRTEDENWLDAVNAIEEFVVANEHCRREN